MMNKTALNSKQIRRISLLSMSVNVFLFFGKLFAALILNSVALLSDAFNHLVDTLNGFIYWLGQKLSNRQPDDNHPQGHGRGEYLTALTIAVFMLIVAAQFLVESIRRILNPIPLQIPGWALTLMVIAILSKLSLFIYFRAVYRRSERLTIKALAIDNLNDVLISILVLISFILQPLLNLSIDAFVGVLIAFLIGYHGWGILLQSVRDVLGKRLSGTEQDKVFQLLKKYPDVLGAHAFILHDYGPTYKILNFHLEVSEHMSLVASHNLVDELEEQLFKMIGYEVIIHLDPMVMDTQFIERIRQEIIQALGSPALQAKILSVRPIKEKHHPEVVIGLHHASELVTIQKILKTKLSHFRFVFEMQARDAVSLLK